MSARPLTEDKTLKALCRSGSLTNKERLDVWLRLLRLSPSKKDIDARKRDYEDLVEDVFLVAPEKVHDGVLGKVPLVHHVVDASQNIRAPRSHTEIILIALAHKNMLLYAGSAYEIIQIMLLVAPPSEVFAMIAELAKYTRKKLGAYFFVDISDEEASAICTIDVALKYLDKTVANDLIRQRSKWNLVIKKWHLTFFRDVLPQSRRLQLMDSFLAEGRKMLIRMTIALLQRSESTSDDVSLQNLVKGQTDEAHDALFRSSFRVRSFARKTIDAAFAAAKKLDVHESDRRAIRSWRRELTFRARHLKRAPLQIRNSDLQQKSTVKESEVARAIPSAVVGGIEDERVTASKVFATEAVKKRGDPSSLSPHTDLWVWGRKMHASSHGGILLCNDRILARLRWWRLKKLLFEVGGDMMDVESDPLLVYASKIHGFGMDNLEHHWQQHPAIRQSLGRKQSESTRSAPLSFILVQTTDGAIFGALVAADLRRGTFCGRFDELAEMFTVFHFDEQTSKFSTHRADVASIKASGEKAAGYVLMITESALVVGGGTETREALYLSEDLQSGHSKASSAFRSPPLSTKENFGVANVEVYLACMR